MDVSENSGTPKSSILIGFSIINHPFWGTPIFGNTHMVVFCGVYTPRTDLLSAQVPIVIASRREGIWRDERSGKEDEPRDAERGGGGNSF